MTNLKLYFKHRALSGVVTVSSKGETYGDLVRRDYARRHDPFLSELVSGLTYDCSCGANHTVGARLLRAGRDVV